MASINKFAGRWAPADNKENVWDKIKDKISPPPPVRHRVTMALYKLKVQKNRLEYTLNKLQQRGNALFEKVVDAQVKKDQARAIMYASEVAEVRKIAKSIMSAIYALERISLRLETVRDVGDLITALGPVVSVVKEVKTRLLGIMPDVAFELSEVDELLQTAVYELGEFTGINMSEIAPSDEAKKVLEEAAAIAEQRMKEQFPEIPISRDSLPAPPTAESAH
ncbi:MAG: Snf7 family protein [Fervidicoccaceae archaeon]|nr:Snf7 family protein [Fervidicoccaceae archaeon]